MHRLITSVGLAVAVGLGLVCDATAQEIATASYERGPRFLLAMATEVVPVDVRKTPVLARRLNLELEGATLKQALAEIAAQSGLVLAYSDDAVPLEKRVHLRAEAITAAAALTDVLFDAGVDVVFKADGSAALVKRPPAPQNGSISGRVTDAKTAAAIVGATVVVEQTSLSATTDSDGRYRIAEVAPGTYTLRARYIGYSPGTASVAVSADQEATADFALVKSVQRLDEVVTTGTVVPTEVRTLPTPISVITETDIALQRPRTLGQVIREAVPSAVGWDLGNDPETTPLAVRGASSFSPLNGGMKVYVDGIEIANRSYAAIDPNSIERVEVIRGPQAATIYGSDAIGGVMQVFTKRGDPTKDRVQVDASTAIGALQTPYAGYGRTLVQRYVASVRGAGERFTYNVGSSYTHYGDWIPEGAQSLPSVYGGIHVDQGKVGLDISGRYYQQRRTAAFSPLFANTGFAYFSKPSFQEYRFQEQTLGARLTWAPTSWLRHHLTVGVDRFFLSGEQSQPRLTTPADTSLFVYDDEEPKTSISYAAFVTGGLGRDVSATATAGVDHYNSRSLLYTSYDAQNTTGAIRGTISGDRSQVTNTGYFGQAQFTYRSAVSLTAGLRAEKNSSLGTDFGTHVSPRVGLAYAVSSATTTVKVRGSYGEGIRPPTPGFSQGKPYAAGSFQLANPNLGPERQKGWDGGVDVAFGSRASLGATYYDQTAEDLIQSVLVSSDPALLYQFQNVGRLKNKGFELEGTLDVGPSRIRAQLAVTNSRVEALAPGYTGDQRVGDRPLAVPKYTAGASVTVFAFPWTTLTGGLTYVGSFTNYDYVAQFACFGGTAPCRGSQRDYLSTYPGFVKIDLSVTQQFTQGLSAFVSVQNAGNNGATEYANTIAVMGRITMIGLEARY